MVRAIWIVVYLAAEIVALYALLMLVAWFAFTFGDMPHKDLGFLVSAVICVPAALAGASIGFPGRPGRGFYHPLRPLAALAQFLDIGLDGTNLPLLGNRQAIDICYRGSDLASYDVITALSEHLRRVGIRHSASGGISVDDNGTVWWLEPEFGERRVKGWVQAADSRDRKLVINAIRKFLREDLGLQLA